MICRFTCGNCGRTWVFESRFINPAEFSCPYQRIGECHMPRDKKKVVVRHTNLHEEHEAETVEQALKDVARKVKRGELTPPFTLEFDGPGASHFSVTVHDDDAVEEIAASGFMF